MTSLNPTYITLLRDTADALFDECEGDNFLGGFYAGVATLAEHLLTGTAPDSLDFADILARME